MRRPRVPTIPNMGLSIQEGDEPLQAYDSAIFADVEEESPPIEKRPTAPHMSSLRRRNASQDEGRYDDAIQDENPSQKRHSSTLELKTLAFPASVQEIAAPENAIAPKENVIRVRKRQQGHSTKEDIIRLQNQKESLSGFDPSNLSILRSKTTPTPTVSRPCLYSHEKSIDANCSKPGQNGSSYLIQRFSLNDTSTMPQRRVTRNELKKPVPKINEIAGRIRNRTIFDKIPGLQRKTQAGLAFVVANIFALFNFLKWASLTFFQFLNNKIRDKQIQQEDVENEVCSSGGLSEQKPKDTKTQEIAQSSTEVQNDVHRFSPSLSFEESSKVEPETRAQPESSVNDKARESPTLDMTEEAIDMMTTVPRLPLQHLSREDMFKDQKAAEHEDNNISLAPNNSTGNSESRINSRIINGISSDTGSGANGSGSEALTNGLSRNNTENLMKELDQDSMHFEHRDSEIILTPLDSTIPTFASDGELDVRDMDRLKYQRRTGTTERPGGLNTEMNQAARLSGRKRGSRVPTGKLKSDVRTMKGSLFRVFGRNKIEPETRFASPRSARKTLALVADMLVKEHGCGVAVRRNGALKLRCEKIFSGSQRLRLRLAFQAMDEFSCNVMVCRSREDDLKVSTTDYVTFVADLQRSFLNATSEAMRGSQRR